jgi:hypothetical protein
VNSTDPNVEDDGVREGGSGKRERSCRLTLGRRRGRVKLGWEGDSWKVCGVGGGGRAGAKRRESEYVQCDEVDREGEGRKTSETRREGGTEWEWIVR